MIVVLGLLAAVFYGVGDFVGGFASRLHSAITVLLHSYPVGALLMLALLPAFPGHLDARVLLFGVAGGLAGLIGVTIMYSLMVIAPHSPRCLLPGYTGPSCAASCRDA
ncbi:MAG TPA: hypothetical protein VGH01_00005 [Jatrophihabitantaceae bacterium]